jgi:glyoxylate reductase
MTRPALYVSRLLPEPVMAEVRTGFHLLNQPQAGPPSRETLLAGLQHAQAAICTLTERIDRDVLEAAPQLKVIANYAVGYNNIDLEAAREREIVVTNTPDVLTDATADLAWALILAVARRITEGHNLVQGGNWSGWDPTQLLGAEVYGRTLGIVGMGRIGQAVARRAGGFNMPVLYCSGRTVEAAAGARPWRRVPLKEVLTGSDFVSLHVPLTPDTRHLIGPAELTHMRPSAILINTSRGPVVDEAALAQALRDGRLAGAGLDVYEQEPGIHPDLRGLPQAVTLPHLGSATLTARVRMGLLCLENVTAVLSGRQAPNRVA